LVGLSVLQAKLRLIRDDYTRQKVHRLGVDLATVRDDVGHSPVLDTEPFNREPPHKLDFSVTPLPIHLETTSLELLERHFSVISASNECLPRGSINSRRITLA